MNKYYKDLVIEIVTSEDSWYRVRITIPKLKVPTYDFGLTYHIKEEEESDEDRILHRLCLKQTELEIKYAALDYIKNKYRKDYPKYSFLTIANLSLIGFEEVISEKEYNN